MSAMLQLVIANKLYSSWSMRPWMVLKAFDIPFREIIIPLRQPDSRERILEYSPSGKVPALIDGPLTVWESLAIIEHLAERHPDRPIWPRHLNARAHARAASSEMHGGFQTLRQACPMNLSGRYGTPEMTPQLRANIDRIEAIWSEARRTDPEAGPYLYGAFSAADAMYAPVVSRFETYGIAVTPQSRAYMTAVQEHPAFIEWCRTALDRSWLIPDYDAGHALIESHL